MKRMIHADIAVMDLYEVTSFQKKLAISAIWPFANIPTCIRCDNAAHPLFKLLHEWLLVLGPDFKAPCMLAVTCVGRLRDERPEGARIKVEGICAAAFAFL